MVPSHILIYAPRNGKARKKNPAGRIHNGLRGPPQSGAYDPFVLIHVVSRLPIILVGVGPGRSVDALPPVPIIVIHLYAELDPPLLVGHAVIHGLHKLIVIEHAAHANVEFPVDGEDHIDPGGTADGFLKHKTVGIRCNIRHQSHGEFCGIRIFIIYLVLYGIIP